MESSRKGTQPVTKKAVSSALNSSANSATEAGRALSRAQSRDLPDDVAPPKIKRRDVRVLTGSGQNVAGAAPAAFTQKSPMSTKRPGSSLGSSMRPGSESAMRPPSSASQSLSGTARSMGSSLRREVSNKESSHTNRKRRERFASEGRLDQRQTSESSATDQIENRRASLDGGLNKTELRTLFSKARQHYVEAKRRNAALGDAAPSRLRMAFDAVLAGSRSQFKTRNILQAWLGEIRLRRQERDEEEAQDLLERELRGEVQDDDSFDDGADAFLSLMLPEFDENDAEDDPNDRGCGNVMSLLSAFGECHQSKQQVMELANTLKETEHSFIQLRTRFKAKLKGLEGINAGIENSVSAADTRVDLVEKKILELQERLLAARKEREAKEAQQEVERQLQEAASAAEAKDDMVGVLPSPSRRGSKVSRSRTKGSPRAPDNLALEELGQASASGDGGISPRVGISGRPRPQHLTLDAGDEDPWLKQQLSARFVRHTEKHIVHTPLMLLKQAAEELQELSDQCGGPELPFVSRIHAALEKASSIVGTETGSGVGSKPRTRASSKPSTLPHTAEGTPAAARAFDGHGFSQQAGASPRFIDGSPRIVGGSPRLASMVDGLAGHCNTISSFPPGTGTMEDDHGPAAGHRPLLLDTVRKACVQVRCMRALTSSSLNSFIRSASQVSVQDVLAPSPRGALGTTDFLNVSVQGTVDNFPHLDGFESKGEPLPSGPEFVEAPEVPEVPEESEEPSQPESRGSWTWTKVEGLYRPETPPTPGGWPVPSNASRNLPGQRLSVIGEELRLPLLPPTQELCWELLNPKSVEAVREDRRRLARGDRPLMVATPRPQVPELPLEEPRSQRPFRPFDGSPLVTTGSRRQSLAPSTMTASKRSTSTSKQSQLSARSTEREPREKVPCSSSAAVWKRRFVFIQETPMPARRQHAYVARHAHCPA